MNAIIWVLQIFLALHTLSGAIWKFSNSEQTINALKAIPHGIWQAMSIIELLCSLALVLPIFFKRLGKLAPIASILIALEMLIFIILFLFSGDKEYNQIMYWFIVAAICAFIAYGRIVTNPIKKN